MNYMGQAPIGTSPTDFSLNEDINQAIFHFLTICWASLDSCQAHQQTGDWKKLLQDLLQASQAAFDSLIAPMSKKEQMVEPMKAVNALILDNDFFWEYSSKFIAEFQYWTNIENSGKDSFDVERLQTFLTKVERFLGVTEQFHLQIKRNIYRSADPGKERLWRLIWWIFGGFLCLFAAGILIANNGEGIKRGLGLKPSSEVSLQ